MLLTSPLSEMLNEGVIWCLLHHELGEEQKSVLVRGTSLLRSRMQRMKFGMGLCKRVSFKSVWMQIEDTRQKKGMRDETGRKKHQGTE